MSLKYRNVVLAVAATVCLSSPAIAGGPGEDEADAAEVTSPPPVAAVVEEEEESFLGDWIPGGFSGSLTLISDYSFRGVSQTQTGFAAQGGVTWKMPIGESPVSIYLGMWNSSVNFSQGPFDDSYLEQDWLGGVTGTVGDFTWDLSATYLWYPKESDLNYWEFAAKGSYNLMDVATLKAGAVYSYDYFGYAGDAGYFSTGAAYPLPIPENRFVTLTLDGNLGYTVAENFVFTGHPNGSVRTDNNYLDWNVGLIVGVHKNLSFDLRYVDTDLSIGSIADQRFVGGATFSF